MTSPTHLKKPRIAFFSDSLPERNGTGAYYFDLLNQLSAFPLSMAIFQPKRQVRLNWLSIPMPGDPSQRLITPNLFRIYRGLKQLKPQIVISITPGPFGILGYLYAKRNNLKFVSAFHTDFEQLTKIYWNPLNRSFANFYLSFINKLFCSHSKYTLINNKKLIPQVEQLGAQKHKVMGTPLPDFHFREPPSNAPEAFEQVCFAGRLAAEKNIDLILDAAKHFKQIRFIIVGDGPLKRSLKEAATELTNVRFTGWVNRSELVKIIDASNCLLLPSKLETFGSIAYEAMARGRPTIVSENSGINQWDSLRAHIVVLKDERNLIQAIQSLIEMTLEERASLGARSRAAAIQFNTMTLEHWMALLNEL